MLIKKHKDIKEKYATITAISILSTKSTLKMRTAPIMVNCVRIIKLKYRNIATEKDIQNTTIVTIDKICNEKVRLPHSRKRDRPDVKIKRSSNLINFLSRNLKERRRDWAKMPTKKIIIVNIKLDYRNYKLLTIL